MRFGGLPGSDLGDVGCVPRPYLAQFDYGYTDAWSLTLIEVGGRTSAGALAASSVLGGSMGRRAHWYC